VRRERSLGINCGGAEGGGGRSRKKAKRSAARGALGRSGLLKGECRVGFSGGSYGERK
jgi:hypothetical protein